MFSGYVGGVLTIPVGFGDGEHNITISMVDPYGNVAEYHKIIIVDTRPPRLRVYGISNNSEVASTLKIRIDAKDPYLENITIYLDREIYAVLETGGETEIILGHGAHTIAIVAYDIAGNRASRTYVVTVKEQQQEEIEDMVEESIPPYPGEEETTIPTTEKEEEPILMLNDPLAKISGAMITISLVAMALAITLRRRRKIMALLLAIAILSGIHFFMTWSIYAKKNDTTERSIARMTMENGTLTIYNCLLYTSPSPRDRG